jgi:hypothetical protein
MMDIAKRMRELIPLLAKGLKGVVLDDVKPECEDQWGPDYAIVFRVYWMSPADLFGEDYYFDDAKFRHDLHQLIKGHFVDGADAGETVVMGSEDRRAGWPPGTVVVNFYERSQEIEVHRVKEEEKAVTPAADSAS